MKATIINNSDYLNTDFLNYLVKFICKGIGNKLPSFSVEYHHTVFDEDKYGKRTYDKSSQWDGTALDDNRIWISIKQNTPFPMLREINPELKGRYLSSVYLVSLEEFLVYITSHEVFHIYQWKNPKEEGFGKKFGGDDETAADLFAITRLSQWRNYHRTI